jgi:hypothetical protein
MQRLNLVARTMVGPYSDGLIDIPANPFGHLDALGVTLLVDMIIFQLLGDFLLSHRSELETRNW